MAYVIHGVRGAEGGPIKARLLAAGIAVSNSPPPFDSVEALTAAYREADGLFIHLPLAPEPVRLDYARNIAKAIGVAKPKRVVVSTSGSIVDQLGTPLQASADSAIMTLIQGIERSGVSSAIVAPRLYLENLLLPVVVERAKTEGRLCYPIPAQYLVSWSSHFDVAEAAERLLTDNSVTGLVGVGHLPGLKGDDLAQAFTEKFGRFVTYEALAPEAFGELITPMFGLASQAVVEFYQLLAKVEANIIDEDTSAQRIFGLRPRSVGEWLNSVGV